MRTAGEAEPEASSILKLPLLSVPPMMHSTDPSGMQTPPLHSSASVPFRWEEEPGKPRPCTTLTNLTTKCLELPPRLLFDTKLPSPTTVLEGPFVGRSRFQSASFRITSGECYGSFSHERSGQLGAITASNKSGVKERGWFGSWGRKAFKAKREVGGSCSHVFPSSLDRESDGGSSVGEGNSTKVKMTKFRRTGSLSNLSHARSHFWATMYKGLKQVVPWGSRKLKKDGTVT
ncbi:uncharacterized protein At4g00950 isoform X2 [Juglans microcarpa x Juglans regia]|uniref:uncharacterized protein At4g00950 isoform X2 n=1 Tax=Juglans microcarpa x Juglans regia TaxID=2249226 RepID=UPI001B7D962B|nr:uncharacterized protein At4g00950 isoform X2 [Juglans microcarpa x Juglans regia]